jgi:hypothetical protein
LAAPEVEGARQRVTVDPGALEGGVVRVLDRQGSQGGPLADGDGGIGGADIAGQHRDGPAVGHDVVERDEQRVVVVG